MADKLDMREEALGVLMDMEKYQKMSHVAIGDALMRLQFVSKQDRAFFTCLCEGVTERRIYLDYILDCFSRTKMEKCKPLIRNLLRLSAYQILFMNTRDAAACNEAVALAKKRGFRGLSGFVNGVLRALIRSKDHLPLPDKKADPLEYCSVCYSVPPWLVELLSDQYGWEQTEIMLQSFLTVRPTTIRASISRISPGALKDMLAEEGVQVSEGSYFPYAFHIDGFNHLSKIPSFRKGFFTVQDESSMLPAAVAGIRKGDHVLDLCAAPGGKTFHAADVAGSDGYVIARDLTEYKTDILHENNDRMKYPQIKIEQWDATKYDASLQEAMDVVLADLPCSGLGVMGRKNDIKYRVSREQIAELVTLQRDILSVAWRYVKPGGTLIYSTCTLNHEENLDNVRWIEAHTPLRLASMEAELPTGLRGRTGDSGYLQLLPGIDACDGFFVSKFVYPIDALHEGSERF
ncbi:MAG: 16S rRNA (cytosine(967)-C(5))-methyltransferase RsmB [Clostridiales bacterium]|nr:16S rRNA (cytosine(967)-C(5))-methyltransferase RsmB [Clostridiales bacterium]